MDEEEEEEEEEDQSSKKKREGGDFSVCTLFYPSFFVSTRVDAACTICCADTSQPVFRVYTVW